MTTVAVPVAAGAIVRRTMDAGWLNTVANHPDVRPWLGGEDGPLDVTPLVQHPGNVALVTEFGGFIGEQIEPNLYEVHSLFLLEGRGGHASSAMRAAFRYMFVSTPCEELVTKVPVNNRAAAGLARVGGFEQLFMRQAAWPTGDGGHCDVDILSLPILRWLLHSAECLDAGRWFHARLEAAKDAAGSARVVHDDDDAHDRAAGLAVLMCHAGNPVKAVRTYNRWARMAGYQSIDLLSDTPVVLDVRDAVVEVTSQDMEILLCR